MEGKVKSLSKFGAFITLPDGSTGMVHISEIAHAYVNDIRDHLTEGQDVKVMIISRENGKTNLSIKRTLPPPAKPQSSRPQNRSYGSAPRSNASNDRVRLRRARRQARPRSRSRNRSTICIKQFMTESSSKMSSIKQYSEHKTKTRRR